MLFYFFELFQSVCSRFLTLHLVLPSSVIRISVVQFSMTKVPLSYSRLFYYSRPIRICQVLFSFFKKTCCLEEKSALRQRATRDLLWQYTTRPGGLSRGKYAKSQKNFMCRHRHARTCIRGHCMLYCYEMQKLYKRRISYGT